VNKKETKNIVRLGLRRFKRLCPRVRKFFASFSQKEALPSPLALNPHPIAMIC
jgi:hypothetical protein